MTLENLGMEYMDRWNILMERIKKLYEQSKTLPPEKRRKVNKRINSLLSSAKACKETANHLLNYYKN